MNSNLKKIMDDKSSTPIQKLLVTISLTLLTEFHNVFPRQTMPQRSPDDNEYESIIKDAVLGSTLQRHIERVSQEAKEVQLKISMKPSAPTLKTRICVLIKQLFNANDPSLKHEWDSEAVLNGYKKVLKITQGVGNTLVERTLRTREFKDREPRSLHWSEYPPLMKDDSCLDLEAKAKAIGIDLGQCCERWAANFLLGTYLKHRKENEKTLQVRLDTTSIIEGNDNGERSGDEDIGCDETEEAVDDADIFAPIIMEPTGEVEETPIVDTSSANNKRQRSRKQASKDSKRQKK